MAGVFGGKDALERTGRGNNEGVSPYISDQLECRDLCLGMDGKTTESLWVGIKGRAGAGDFIVGMVYRLLARKTECLRCSTDR